MRHDTETHCHCGAEYGGSDHCPECACEQYESGDCGHQHQMTIEECIAICDDFETFAAAQRWAEAR